MSSTTKKLSIEERLSLAAKAKSKRKIKKVGSSTSPPPLDESSTTIEGGLAPDEKQTDDKVNDAEDATKEPSPLSRILPSDYQELSKEALLGVLGPIFTQHTEQISQLSSQVEYLRDRNSKEAQIQANDASLLRLLKEKDDKIKLLLQEGEKLSKLELQHSNIIKSLRSSVKDLEFVLESHKGELKDRANECEKVYKEIEDLRTKNEQSKSSLEKAEKEKNEALKKYEDILSGELQSLTEKLHQVEEERDTLKTQLQRTKDANETNQLKTSMQYDALKVTSQEEITRLETSLEQLRIELDKHSSRDSNGDSASSEEHKHSDTVSLVQYKLLEEQLKNSKENWSAIEYSLNNRLAELQASLKDLEGSRTVVEKNNEEVLRENQSLQTKIEILEDEKSAANKEVENLHQEISTIKSSLKECQREFDLLNEKYEVQKSQLENTIFTEHAPHRIRSDTTLSDTVKPDVSQSFEDIDDISKWDLQNNNSIGNSVLDIHDEELDDASYDLHKESNESVDLDSFPRKDSLTSLNFVSSQQITTTKSHQNNHMNAQMISKLGGEVRRLETELSALQESYERLQKEKLKANDNMIKLMEENDLSHKLERERDELASQVEGLEQKLNASLQLLGEKSERVEELQNDVDDLKEMLQMQFQQIVELQEKTR
ncbi:LAFE_0A01024g1_1 [Lachancea fermentati]|uniref:LAFE_0A01024g1_1 n=1 Tax=Lachancea fermentati TaxID=4955 RepID=A0A1G4M695_LACFM|nr:LAFE_0A01024g1_1 [Lachancea fermentati]